MKFIEYIGKSVLTEYGISIPKGKIIFETVAAEIVARELGPVVVKAQVPEGKRGKAGGIKSADNPEQARLAAENIIGMKIGGNIVRTLLVEEKKSIDYEFYAAVLTNPESKSPMMLFSASGGVDVETSAQKNKKLMNSLIIDVRHGLSLNEARNILSGVELNGLENKVADVLVKLYKAYEGSDADLLEINPLAVIGTEVVALDCKFVMDDSGVKRQGKLASQGAAEELTELEQMGQKIGLHFIELDGDVGVLANGAGLTMTTMDVVRNYGGKPANFLEIGGEAYTKSKDALELVLKNKKVKSLVINFCGAFARTDVMTEGILNAIEDLNVNLPIFWSIHGTGDTEAIIMLKDRLGVVPYPTMDAASKAAAEAAEKPV